MDFNFTEEQMMLKETARQFTEHEIEPLAVQIDVNGRLPDDLINRTIRNGYAGAIWRN